MPNFSGVWSLPAQYQAIGAGNWPFSPGNTPPIGLFGGGADGIDYINVIEQITISSTGNATDFGDLTQITSDIAACGSSTRGVFAGGIITGGVVTNVIEYVTFLTSGNATDFGDLLAGTMSMSGGSNSARGLFFGGNVSSFSGARINVIQYITLASTGNATDFGDLSYTTKKGSSCASSTRALFGGGDTASLGFVNIIEYVTIASTGNAASFGDLNNSVESPTSCSSSTRGLFAGGKLAGSPYTINTIEYVTIASSGNATDFGDLSQASYGGLASCSSSTRGVFAGGNINGALTNVIEYVTISSTGNTTDFGDLSVGKEDLAGCSNAHGGLS